MTPAESHYGPVHILYDLERFEAEPTPALFDPGSLARQGAVVGNPQRDRRWMTLPVEIAGTPALLRHYRRGITAGHWLLGDRYVWPGLRRTRPWREWRLLATLHGEGLPVPQPLAAYAARHGIFYEGAILTERPSGCRALVERLQERPLEPGLWRSLGRALRRLHDAGVHPAELDARGIALTGDDRPIFLNLDGARRTRPDPRWQRSQLARLRADLVGRARRAGLQVREEDLHALDEAYGAL